VERVYPSIQGCRPQHLGDIADSQEDPNRLLEKIFGSGSNESAMGIGRW
jgi:hypothetical protein